jgi:hypothetical protein
MPWCLLYVGPAFYAINNPVSGSEIQKLKQLKALRDANKATLVGDEKKR